MSVYGLTPVPDPCPEADTAEDRVVVFSEITWPNGQVELHPRGGGEPIVVRGPDTLRRPMADPDGSFVPIYPYVDENGNRPTIGPRDESPEARARRAAMMARVFAGETVTIGNVSAGETLTQEGLQRMADESGVGRYMADLMRLPEVEYHRLTQGDWSDLPEPEPPTSANARRAMRRRSEHMAGQAMDITWHHGPTDYRSEMRAARDRIAELEAENAALRAAAGYGPDNAPALGGPNATI